MEEGFAQKPPGPSPQDSSHLSERIGKLEVANKRLEQENEQLTIRLKHSVEVTPERLNRFLLTGLGEVLPYETLQTMVEVAYGEEYVPSVGTLSNLVNHTGTIAGLILDSEKVKNSFQAAACDEIFFHQQPILTVVEPDTMAIGAIKRSSDRKGESWEKVLSYFPKLRYVISDQALGLTKGIQLRGNLIHQGDLYHFLREVAQTTRQLEKRFKQILEQEEKAWDNWFKGNIYTPTLENTLVEVDTFLEKMEQYYQTIERLSDAFYPITEDGRLLTKMRAKQILAEVIHSLSNLEDEFELGDLIKHVRKAKEYCLSFIEEISYQLGQLAQELPSSLPIEKSEFLRLAIHEVCLRYALMQGARLEDEYACLWETLSC